MKLSKQIIDDLLTLTEHAYRDMSYGEGGTYNTDKNGDGNFEYYDKVAAKKVIRACDFIKNLILTRK